ALVTFAALICLAACSRVPQVDESAAKAILSDAAKVLTTSPIGSLSESKWPDSFSRLSPSRVLVAEEGIYIATSVFFVDQAGIFVPRNPETFSAEPGGDPAYYPIFPGLYEFRIKG
ncbi:MAG TPA: hypothetical protein VFG91_08070, partial [Woeseiaceae bacterium]|nr:hypothetical protein [Woeseiaceae bacterium]